MKIQESGENYLETILMLRNRNGSVRAVDVASELSFAKPSVSRAMSILKNAGFLTVEKNGNLVLTAEGEAKASAVYERHTILSEFLRTVLGVSEEAAAQDACRIEHVISGESFEKIKIFMQEEGEKA